MDPVKVTFDEFMRHCHEDQRDRLTHEYFTVGRLIAWGAPPEDMLPYYMQSQDSDNIVADNFGNRWECSNSDYDHIAFYCDRPCQVYPLHIWEAYPHSDLLNCLRPMVAETFQEWLDRNFESLGNTPREDCGDTLFQFLVRELSENCHMQDDTNVSLNREACSERLSRAITDLVKVKLALENYGK